MTLTVSLETAPSIIAGFVKEGMHFVANERDGVILITFTGGF